MGGWAAWFRWEHQSQASGDLLAALGSDIAEKLRQEDHNDTLFPDRPAVGLCFDTDEEFSDDDELAKFPKNLWNYNAVGENHTGAAWLSSKKDNEPSQCP